MLGADYRPTDNWPVPYWCISTPKQSTMPRCHVQTTSRSVRVQSLQMSGLIPGLRQADGTAELDAESSLLSGSRPATPRVRTHSCTKSERNTTQCNKTIIRLLLWKISSAHLWNLGTRRNSHSNSTTFELWTLSADSKFVEFFHIPVIEFEPQVYRISTTCLHPPATGTTNWTTMYNPLNKCALPNSLKGPKIILDMADRHISKDGPFRILGNAFIYLLSDFFGITFLLFIIDTLTYH